MFPVVIRDQESKPVPAVLTAMGTATNARIIIVDDNIHSGFEMVCYFESFGMKATSVSGAPELYRRLAPSGSYLVILELQLARERGFDLLRKLRDEFHVPVILTGGSPNDTEGIVGLESGADDYLVKPVSLRELVARARAILRRKPGNVAGPPPRGLQCRGYVFNGWTLDRRVRVLRDETGEPLALTKSEFSLLTAFLEKPGIILTRVQLLHAVHLHPNIADRSIDVTVARLRRKLQNRQDAPSVIETARAIGYSLNAAVEAF
jgi:two-component system OmpR family response regulator